MIEPLEIALIDFLSILIRVDSSDLTCFSSPWLVSHGIISGNGSGSSWGLCASSHGPHRWQAAVLVWQGLCGERYQDWQRWQGWPKQEPWGGGGNLKIIQYMTTYWKSSMSLTYLCWRKMTVTITMSLKHFRNMSGFFGVWQSAALRWKRWRKSTSRFLADHSSINQRVTEHWLNHCKWHCSLACMLGLDQSTDNRPLLLINQPD